MKRIIIYFSLFFSMTFYGQNDTISIIRHTDNDLIIPKNIKVVFRGIPNELFINVPDVKSFKVSGNGISKKSKNIYYLNPRAGNEVIISIEIVLNTNKIKSEKHIFKIRNLPSPVSTINYNKEGYIKMLKNQLKNAIIDIIIPDKNIDFDFLVYSFKIKIPNKPEIVISGNKIDNSTFEYINRSVSRGDEILIYDFKYQIKPNFTGFICKITNIVISII